MCIYSFNSARIMQDLNEKEFREIFACILKHARNREPLVKMISNNCRSWSGQKLKMASLEILEKKLFWILHSSSVETILFFDNNGLLNRDPINAITARVLKMKNLYSDNRFNSFKRNERK